MGGWTSVSMIDCCLWGCRIPCFGKAAFCGSRANPEAENQSLGCVWWGAGKVSGVAARAAPFRGRGVRACQHALCLCDHRLGKGPEGLGLHSVHLYIHTMEPSVRSFSQQPPKWAQDPRGRDVTATPEQLPSFSERKSPELPGTLPPSEGDTDLHTL